MLISPYVEATNQSELRYMTEAGFDVIHELGLGLPGSDAYIEVTPDQWLDITCDNSRPEAEGYFLSCTNTRMIETIEAVESRLARPVVSSNQAALWACLRRMGRSPAIPGLGRLWRRGEDRCPSPTHWPSARVQRKPGGFETRILHGMSRGNSCSRAGLDCKGRFKRHPHTE